MTLAEGFLSGTWLGGSLAVAGATLGAVGIFLIARTALGMALRDRGAGPWLRRMEAGLRGDAFSYLLVLRLLPLFPFWLANPAPAMLGVPLSTLAAATAIGIMSATFVCAGVGSGLGAVPDHGEAPNFGLVLGPRVPLPLLGLALLALLPVVRHRPPSVARARRAAGF